MLTDVCFYNKKEACGKVLTHTGDRLGNTAAPCVEEIKLNLTNNAAIHKIGGFAFVVNAASGEKLQDVNATITFKSNDETTLHDGSQPASSAISRIEGHGVVAAILLLQSGQLHLHFPNTPSKGRNFQQSATDIRKAIGRAMGRAAIGNELQGDYQLEKDEAIVISASPDPDGESALNSILTGHGDDLRIGCARYGKR